MNNSATLAQINNEKSLSAKGQKRIASILSTAGKVLAEHGPEDFSVNRVAAEAGISLGNLQYYFPKKKDLMYALLNNMFQPWIAQLEQAVTEQADAECDKQLLRHMLELAFVSNTSDENCAVVWVCTAMALYDDEVLAMLDEWYVLFRHLVAKGLERSNPKLSKQRRESISLFIVATIEGHAMIWRHSASDRRKLNKMNKDFIDYVLQLVEE